MRILVVFYSLSGNTRKLATSLAKELDADVEELHCRQYAPGFMGFIRAGRDSWLGRLPPLEPTSRQPSQYDLVVVAGPIWAWHTATPVRAWLAREHAQVRRVAFLLTHGGSGGETSLRELEGVAAKAPVASLLVREADIRSGKSTEAVSAFAAKLRAVRSV